MPRESLLVQHIVKAIKHRDPSAWVFKVVGGPAQQVGVPDILALVDGRLHGIEVKHQRPGESAEHARGRATRVQLHQIKQIKAAGGRAGVVLTVAEALAMIWGETDG